MRRNRPRKKTNKLRKRGRKKSWFHITYGTKADIINTKSLGGCNFFETLVGPSNVPVAGSVTDLCLIPQGITREDRVFDFSRLKKIQIHYNISTENSDIFSSVRIGFFVWRPNTVPNYASIFQNGSSTVYPFYQFDNAQEYSRLYDKIHAMAGTATAPTPSGNVTRFLTIHFHKGGLPLKFIAGTTAGTNHVYLVISGDSALSPFPLIILNARLIYKNNV